MRKQTYSITEAATILGVGRDGLYRAVRENRIPVLRLGKRRCRIPVEVIQAILADPSSIKSGEG